MPKPKFQISARTGTVNERIAFLEQQRLEIVQQMNAYTSKMNTIKGVTNATLSPLIGQSVEQLQKQNATHMNNSAYRVIVLKRGER